MAKLPLPNAIELPNGSLICNQRMRARFRSRNRATPLRFTYAQNTSSGLPSPCRNDVSCYVPRQDIGIKKRGTKVLIPSMFVCANCLARLAHVLFEDEIKTQTVEEGLAACAEKEILFNEEVAQHKKDTADLVNQKLKTWRFPVVNWK